MKKNTLIFILILIIQTGAFSQTCLPEGITFNLQQDIDAFTQDYPSCTEIEGDVIISGGWDLDSLYKITRIGGSLRVLGNTQIHDLIGLESLSAIDGYFEIFACDNIENLDGVESLTSIGGKLDIYMNAKLENINGLSNLKTVGDHLHILYNYKLTDISGLLGLNSIGNSSLVLQENRELTSLYGLDNIDPNTISDFRIYSNDNLNACSVKSVCDYIINSTGFLAIYSNETGCNSIDEVSEECFSFTNNEDFESKIILSPNPATDILNILIPRNSAISEVTVYNSFGKRQLHQITSSNKIDVSNLSNGIYVLETFVNDSKYRTKFIVRR